MVTQKNTVFFNHNHHVIYVRGCTSLLDVLAFEGKETLSQPFHYRIEFTCADKALDQADFLLKPAGLTLHAPVAQPWGRCKLEPVRTIHGVVTGFEYLGSSRDEAHYALVLQPRMALLSNANNNAIFQDMSVPQIVESILRERHNMRGQDFLFSLTHKYPRREQVMQYGESDLRFISRLLSEVGIWFRFTPDTRLKIDVIEFFDSSHGYEKGLVLPDIPPSGHNDNGVDAVWGIERYYQVVTQKVSVQDYHYLNAGADMHVQVDITRGDSTTYGEAYHWGSHYSEPGDRFTRPLPVETGVFYARLHHERYLNGKAGMAGNSNCAVLAPGKVVNLADPAQEGGSLSPGMLVTSISCSARRDSCFTAHFTALPFTHDYCFRPQLIPHPQMSGTVPARVTSTTKNDIYGHIDKHGRYRVKLLFDRATWPEGSESLWVRQARPYAGETFGFHLPLLAGTEVAIAFEDGNPDRPYIAGALHNSSHPDLVTIRNYRRNVLRTPANNKIRLEDARNQEHIKVSTEYGGKSQLNLGHLVNSERQIRGEGFELRTDLWGAIRAKNGVLISADAQPSARGEQREMQAAISLLKGALLDLTRWGSIAPVHQNFPPDTAGLEHLVEGAAGLSSPVVVLSAPQGIAAVTPASALLHTGKSLHLQSQGEVQIATSARHAVNAAKSISLLAHQEGMRLVSAKGPLAVESHNDTLSLSALQDISVRSVQGQLTLTATKGITLACGGAAIHLSAQGNIEICSKGPLILKGAHCWLPPETFSSSSAGMPASAAAIPAAVCEGCLQRAQEQATGVVLRG
ncbi:type IV secretion protein Rhs [Mangrovibacter phragmitis]|uniref:Type IV secretion protein Rhs n=1 Tax=Mangrovibacter phragmitis TaxID=1691903 RepID=A0A1B7L747_9ENTR|nr:type VI secretion system Vgr family protein [Mangrovibacter phragmitis]OAT78214.1 type IV secretion protein Rhs [Mangrovibacter phragmitis]